MTKRGDDITTFFRYFLFLGERGISKVCSVGTRWMRNLHPHPMSVHTRNSSKKRGRYVENSNKKIIFLWQICQVNHYGWIILLKFYWFLNSSTLRNYGRLVFSYDGTFSYKAHFRPQISSNATSSKKPPNRWNYFRSRQAWWIG